MHHFQGYFSRTLSFNFQDFPGPGIFKKKNPGLSRRHGNAANYSCIIFPAAVLPLRAW